MYNDGLYIDGASSRIARGGLAGQAGVANAGYVQLAHLMDSQKISFIETQTRGSKQKVVTPWNLIEKNNLKFILTLFTPGFWKHLIPGAGKNNFYLKNRLTFENQTWYTIKRATLEHFDTFFKNIFAPKSLWIRNHYGDYPQNRIYNSNFITRLRAKLILNI